MRMDDGLALELGRAVIGLVDQKFAKQIRLAFELLRCKIVAQQIGHLVTKHGDAARLNSNDRRSGFDVSAQSGQCLFQRGFGLIEHAEVIERTPTAERLLRNSYLITRVLQNFNGGFGDRRMEVIAEGIRPENDWRSVLIA